VRTEDGELIEKCLAGEATAFGLLVDKYKESIYAHAYTFVHNFADAEDLTQEVFLKAYQQLRTLKRYDRFPAWLYAIASNLCKDFLRRQSRRPRSESFEADEEPKEIAELSMAAHRERVVHESLHDALKELPDMYQQVLTLHYLAGMKSREIAAFLGTSKNTIDQRLYRAKAQLKTEMLATMPVAFEANALRPGFTFRIVEQLKQLRIRPAPQTVGLPFGLSAASCLIIGLLTFTSVLNSLPPNLSRLVGAPLPSPVKVTTVGEIPVEAQKPITIHFILSGDNADGEYPSQRRRLEMNRTATNPQPINQTTPPGERTVAFPDDVAMGGLRIADWDAELNDEFDTGFGPFAEILGEARGQITVPAGKMLVLELSNDGREHLEALQTLDPNDLQGISYMNSEIDALAHLTGLKYLLISGAETLSDADLQSLRKLPSLEVLSIHGNHTLDAGLAALKELPHLTGLRLRAEYDVEGARLTLSDRAMSDVTSIQTLEQLGFFSVYGLTPEGFKNLHQLKSLRMLKVTHVHDVPIDFIANQVKDLPLEMLWLDSFEKMVTDTGLAAIAKGRRNTGIPLTTFNLEHATQVTDDGVASVLKVVPLENIEHFGVTGAENCTDALMDYVNQMVNVRSLGLRGTPITDAGLQSMGTLPHLESLGLSRTKVTDECIPHLLKLQSLKGLRVEKTGVSAEGIRRLQAGLPNCNVSRNQTN
jgi:RNA polymerase sigma-70 factor, ECF subfamily